MNETDETSEVVVLSYTCASYDRTGTVFSRNVRRAEFINGEDCLDQALAEYELGATFVALSVGGDSMWEDC